MLVSRNATIFKASSILSTRMKNGCKAATHTHHHHHVSCAYGLWRRPRLDAEGCLDERLHFIHAAVGRIHITGGHTARDGSGGGGADGVPLLAIEVNEAGAGGGQGI